MKPLLEIRDYRLAFDGFDGTAAVLDGINLKLQAGDTLGIVGETGCGKAGIFNQGWPTRNTRAIYRHNNWLPSSDGRVT